MTTVYFIRHCTSDFTVRDDRTRPLTPDGLRDTAYVTAFLNGKNIGAVYSSPYRRALDTVTPFAASVGLEVRTVEDFRERESSSVWLNDVDLREFVRRQWTNFAHALPDGERLGEVQRRNIAALEGILTQNEGENIAVGTHGTALSTMINYYDSSYGYADFMDMVYIMPWVVKMEFEGMECLSIEKIDIMKRFPKVIHILGASGGGTSALGRAVSERFGHVHLDADDFFWMPTDPAFTIKREREERTRLLSGAVDGCGRCVISGSMCGWGDALIPRLELCVLVETPTDIRMRRLKEREYARFGGRINPGGDMYENHLQFLEWAAGYDGGGEDTRSRALHDKWLDGVSCPVAEVDGTLPLEELLAAVGDMVYSGGK